MTARDKIEERLKEVEDRYNQYRYNPITEGYIEALEFALDAIDENE